MAHIIAIYNFKGGVGKTTSTLNLARNWSKSFKVLMIDSDPQANLTQTVIKNKPDKTLFNLCKTSMHHAHFKFEPLEINPYLHMIPASIELNELEANNQFISFGQVIMKDILNYVKGKYDLILVDCPSHFGNLVKSILANSQSLLVPSSADSFSLSGISQLLEYIHSVKVSSQINLLGIFFNMFQSNTLYQKEILKEAKTFYGNIILDQTVRRTIKMNEATDQGKALNSLDPLSSGGKDIMLLCEELIDRMDRTTLHKYMQSNSVTYA
ncbi:MAG: ParA family protein [bacterium]|nr:ParA family protein [bacterium]